MSGIRFGTAPCACDPAGVRQRLVAITGGPGAGKTAVLEMASRAFCRHIAVLPEAAGVVFGGGFPRESSAAARRAAQRAIYHIQRELEALASSLEGVVVALCDRGTLDGLAYWPGPERDYWADLGVAQDDELARYHAVLHLETPSGEQGYNRANALRIESAHEARSLDTRIADVWSRHPGRQIVPAMDDFIDKAVRALELLRAQLPPCCRSHPLPGGGPTSGA